VVQTALIGGPETIRQRLFAYEAAGVHEVVLRFVNGTDVEGIRRFAKEFVVKGVVNAGHRP
jgi:hypothetical protein